MSEPASPPARRDVAPLVIGPSPTIQTASELIHRSRKFELHRKSFRRPNGKELKRDVCVHPGAVIILAVDTQDRCVLIRNDRPQVGRVLRELPAGTREPGEPPEVTAGRELIEETGYQAARLELLGTFFASPGVLTELQYAYLATHLTHVGTQLEEDEHIEVELVPTGDLLNLAATGQIEDSKSLACLMLFALRRGMLRPT